MYGYHWGKIDVGHYWDLKGLSLPWLFFKKFVFILKPNTHINQCEQQTSWAFEEPIYKLLEDSALQLNFTKSYKQPPN